MLAVLEAIIFAVNADARAESMPKLIPRSDDHDGACSVRGHGEVVNDDRYTLHLQKTRCTDEFGAIELYRRIGH